MSAGAGASDGGAAGGGAPELAAEVARRRTFAIISHPDAGKTTLTEKLLLYGGAIQEAGAVKAKGQQRKATSDWMEIEKQRGISITSTVLQFEYSGFALNLLDTPGHQDFSEDTFRTLTAADNSIMLVDGAKGLEPQTLKLFEVCRLRGLPIFTMINKLDRPSLNPLELCDEIEAKLGISTFPINWPIGSGDRFRGVVHRPTREVHLFQRGESGGRTEATSVVVAMDDPGLADGSYGIDPELWAEVVEEVGVLDEVVGNELDVEGILRGAVSPVFFGSAMNNFGVELLLSEFLKMAEAPRGQESLEAGTVEATSPEFSGFIFKLQANMDPKHRDRIAFMRVVSGRFDKGMKVKHPRSGKTITLSQGQKLFADERGTVDVAYPGDIVGLNNPGVFAIGDTVHTGPGTLNFPGIPSFSPEVFAKLRATDPGARKSFNAGVEQLMEEGAVQVMYSTDEFKAQEPILAAVGQLQIEVVVARMQNEYGVACATEGLPFQRARWVKEGWDGLDKAGRLANATPVKDRYGRPVLLFRNEWNLEQLEAQAADTGLTLLPFAMAPSTAAAAAAAKR